MKTIKRDNLDAACRLASTHMHTHPRNLREYKVMGAGIRAGASHLTDERSLALAVFRLDHHLTLSQLYRGGEALSLECLFWSPLLLPRWRACSRQSHVASIQDALPMCSLEERRRAIHTAHRR